MTVGVPHLVLPGDESVAAAPVASVGPALRRHPRLGPAGANVDFVRFRDRHHVDLRTFERGVEAETLACGTGAVAAAAVGLAAGRCRLPAAVRTTGGFTLTVDRRPAEGSAAERWTLAGDARMVARGVLLPEAGELPDPPDW